MENRFLFRGKQLETGEWIYGYYGFKELNTNDEHFIIQETLNTANDTFPSYFVDSIVAPETVGQCTGVEDKNHKMTWVCDKIEAEFDNGMYKYKEVFEVVFHEGCFGIFKAHGSVPSHKTFMPLRDLYVGTDYEYISNVGSEPTKYTSMFEVIGTIHDTPKED